MHDKFLAYFDEVARQGSIRKAASLLNVSSTSVNRKILSIERRMGIRLFNRHSDGVELTAAGAVVLEHCRKTIFDYQKIMKSVEDIRELRAGHINIATLDSVALSVLPDVLSQFSKEYPEITYAVQTAQPDEIMQAVAEGAVDVGISFVNELLPSVRIHTEKATPIGAVMRPNHPLAERDSIHFDDLSTFQIIKSMDNATKISLFDEALAEVGAKAPAQLLTNSLPLARSLVLNNQGIGIYSKIGFLNEIEAGDLRYVSIQSPYLRNLKIGVMQSARNNPTPSIQVFTRVLSKSLRALRLDS